MARQVRYRPGQAVTPEARELVPAPAAGPLAAGNQAPAPVVARKVGWEKAGAANAGSARGRAGVGSRSTASRAPAARPGDRRHAPAAPARHRRRPAAPARVHARLRDRRRPRRLQDRGADGRGGQGAARHPPAGQRDSDFTAGAGKAFDADAFIAAVFARLTAEGYSGGAGAGAGDHVQPLRRRPADDGDAQRGGARKAPEKLAGLFLFDTMIASAFGGAVWSYVDGRIGAELEHLRQMKLADPESLAVEAQMATWIRRTGSG